MKRRSFFSSALGVFCLSAFLFCGDNGPSGPGTGPLPGKYQVSNSSFTISHGDSIDTMTTITLPAGSCQGIDTGAPAAGTPDTVKYIYNLKNDSLLAIIDLITLKVFPDKIIFWGLAGIKIWYIFTGAHAPNDISGTWSIVGAKAEYTNLLTTIGTIRSVDSTLAARKQAILDVGMTLVISGGQMQIFMKSYADQFVKDWNTCGKLLNTQDTCTYNVTVTKVSDNSVTITGNVSKSTATIFQDGAGNLYFSNTNPEYGPHTYYVNPVKCPNELAPVWWNPFLAANQK
jgi:hypothetical protein